MSQSIPTGNIPPGNPWGLAKKTCPRGRDLTFENCPGAGNSRRTGILWKMKFRLKKSSVDQIFTVKKKKTNRIFDIYRGLRVFSMEFLLVYRLIFWFCYHTHLAKILKSCPWLVYILSFHWVMIILTYFCTKDYDYVKCFFRVFVLLVINTGCPRILLKMGNTALLISN